MENKDEILVKNYQQNDCVESFTLLSQKYLGPINRYAKKFLDVSVYSDLVSYDADDLKSYTLLSFHKTLTTFRCGEGNKMSFKNYLYQTVRFDSLKEIKNVLNTKKIPSYKALKKDMMLHAQYENSKSTINSGVYNLESFLNSKMCQKPIYKDILLLKAMGYKESETGIMLNLTKTQIKSRFQYIKKINKNN